MEVSLATPPIATHLLKTPSEVDCNHSVVNEKIYEHYKYHGVVFSMISLHLANTGQLILFTQNL